MNSGLVVAGRLVAVVAMFTVWHKSQSMIGAREQPDGQIGDKLHDWMAPIHAFLQRTPLAVRGLLIVSSLGIDGLGLTVLHRGLFGPSFSPILGLALLLVLRQSAQYLTALPAPPGMIWRDPGFPSLLVTYGVANDMFFSGHTALAVFGACTLASMGHPGWGLGLAVFEIFTVMALRAHWTMDVYAGILSALACFWAASWLLP